MRLVLSLLLLAAALPAASGPAAAQTQTVLFPGETGATLRASLKAAYRPASLGNYSAAQDLLMGTIDRTTVGGQPGVVCVYTGYFVPFDGSPSTDPNQDVFNNGAGINTEHTWPQSLLNGDPGPRSDLHHLFPSQVDANSARGNFQFGEVADTQTTRWYRGGPPYSQTAIPASNIDEYSELLSGTRFEPREDHKGNVARAVFYMRTIWDGQVTTSFLSDAQARDLYQWHYQDAITQADQDRSARVALRQSNKDNPFVLDSTLVRRAFFPDIVVADEDGPATAAATLALTGENPFRRTARLELRLAAPAQVRAEAFDALGRRVAVLFDGMAGTAPVELRLDGGGLAPGVYAIRVAAGGTVLTQRVVHTR